MEAAAMSYMQRRLTHCDGSLGFDCDFLVFWRGASIGSGERLALARERGIGASAVVSTAVSFELARKRHRYAHRARDWRRLLAHLRGYVGRHGCHGSLRFPARTAGIYDIAHAPCGVRRRPRPHGRHRSPEVALASSFSSSRHKAGSY